VYQKLLKTTETPLFGKLLKTGQLLCYDPTGNFDSTTGQALTIPCAGTGQDGETQAGISFSYIATANGTIFDAVTGLTWQKDGTSYGALADALAACTKNSAQLPGTGWRLPNIRELASLIDYREGYPSINSSFSSTADDYYWSSTTYQLAGHDEGQAWIVDFTDGSQIKLPKSMGNFFRCVRG
jgi:hypothetical protein